VLEVRVSKAKIQRVVKTEEVGIELDLKQMKSALALLRDLSSVKKIRDQAVAMRTFLRQQGAAVEIQMDAAELYLWAVRRVGEMTDDFETAPGKRTDLQPSITMLPGSKLDLLKEHGITKLQASRWEAVSRVPELTLVSYIERERGGNKAPTVAGILREQRAIEREQRRRDALAEMEAEQDEAGTITLCSIEEAFVEAGSVDMVFTDPPYHDEHVDLYDRLGELAVHALKPGGFCLVYAGKLYLPDLFSALGRHLDYFWQFIVFHPFSKSRVNSKAIYENYRPILAFRKPGGKNQGPEWVSDIVRGTRADAGRDDKPGKHKAAHPWQQDEDAPRQYIEAYTDPGATVLDPFSGGGTTAAVCKAIGRRFICFDADASAVKLSLARVRGVTVQPSSNDNLEETAS
jgi:DNA modification methylase